MRLLILLAAFYATEISAQEILSCEARSADILDEDLESSSTSKFYPTIIINADNNSVTYAYTKHGMQFKWLFRIEEQTKDKLIGVEKFSENGLHIIYFDKVSKKFSKFFTTSKDVFGNTMTAGKCFN